MNEDLRRAFPFVANGDMGGVRSEVSRYGVAIFNQALPLRYDSNYLLVDQLPNGVSPDDLSREARRLDRPAIMVRDERTGERLVPGFEQLGWQLHRGLVMAHRRPPERTADTGLVQEVDEAALRPARRAQLAGSPGRRRRWWSSSWPPSWPLLGSWWRAFAVLVDGQVASYVDLYSDGRTAQLEDLATLGQYRGCGYASALVLHTLQEARRAGCDLVFLVADAQDWPKALYRRLGFDELGRYVKFIRPD